MAVGNTRGRDCVRGTLAVAMHDDSEWMNGHSCTRRKAVNAESNSVYYLLLPPSRFQHQAGMQSTTLRTMRYTSEWPMCITLWQFGQTEPQISNRTGDIGQHPRSCRFISRPSRTYARIAVGSSLLYRIEMKMRRCRPIVHMNWVKWHVNTSVVAAGILNKLMSFAYNRRYLY